MKYTVFVDDNFHHGDKEARTAHGEFETLQAAIDAAKSIVDDSLLHDHEPGMSASLLYTRYTMFGDDPWVAGAENTPFSAWDFAKARCEIMCAARDA